MSIEVSLKRLAAEVLVARMAKQLARVTTSQFSIAWQRTATVFSLLAKIKTSFDKGGAATMFLTAQLELWPYVVVFA